MLVGELRDADQVALVTYGDRADVYVVKELPFEAAQQLREPREFLGVLPHLARGR